MALANSVSGRSLGVRGSFGVRPALPVLRAVKPGREYREADDTITNSQGVTQKADDALYADAPAVKAARAARPPDNLSKEMKAKLREEYYGLGGSADKASAPAPVLRRPIVAAGTVVYEERAVGTTQNAEATTSEPAAKKGASKWVIDESENLKTTGEQRAWTFASIGLMAATFQVATSQVESSGDVVTLGAALAAAYVMSDFATGVYHWSVDNYGDGNTPVFGRQIAAFQGHHQRPWTITQREFCNNVFQVFKPASFAAMAFYAVSPIAPMAWNAWASSFLFLVCMSQQFHAWSHMKKSELHPVVVALQEAGVLISRKDHGAHHRAPFEGKYCIVSGLWNTTLDDSQFFRKAEKFIHEKTGVEPRCWHEPEHDWKELEAPAGLGL